MAKPKLALIPATQGSKLYSVLPADGVGDFNFSRGTTATRINKDGLIETVASGVSRLNYPLIDGVVNGCPSHLLEPQRTNLITYSEDFSQWVLSNSGNGQIPILTSNYTTNLGLNASRIIFNRTSASASNVSAIRGNDFTQSTNTFSVYIKSNTSNVNIDFRLGSSILIYEITTEWKRIEISGSDFYRSYFGLLGNDSNVYADISIVAAQVEQGSYATSYIPTSGSAVPRSAETASGSGDANTFNGSGVFFAEISALSNDLTNRIISISDGTADNRFLLSFSTNSNEISVLLRVGGVPEGNFSFVLNNILSLNKIAYKFSETEFALWVNGVKVDSVTGNFDVWNNNVVNNLRFSSRDGSYPFYGNVKQIQYFDSVLTDAELQALTSN